MDTAVSTTEDTRQPCDAEATARAWAADGKEVPLQGTVVHTQAHRTVAVYCGVAACLSFGAMAAPDPAFAAIAITALSAVIDLNGGRGWLRGLRSRSAEHNVVTWPAQQHGPTLLITAPRNHQLTLSETPSWLLHIPLGLLGISGIGCAVSQRWPDVAQATLMSTGICLTILTLVAMAWRLFSRAPTDENPARHAIEMAMGQLDRAELKHLRCAFALIGGELGHHDGIEILLRNYSHRLRPDSTRILILHPETGPIGAVHHEGRVRPVRSDGLLLGAMRRLGLPGRTRTTAAMRARRAGWRAAAMTVGPDQVHAAAGIVKKIAEDLDADLAARGYPA